MKNEGALRMRFFRHDGIYRSDVSFPLFTPGTCPALRSGRCQGIRRAGKNTPCPSSAMSSGRLFLDRVARQQGPSPLRRQGHHKTLDGLAERKYHRTASSGLTGCLTLGVHPTRDRREALSHAGFPSWTTRIRVPSSSCVQSSTSYIHRRCKNCTVLCRSLEMTLFRLS